MKIFHTNDIHSDYENAGRLASFLCANRTSDDLYIDAGDFGDLKSLIVVGSKGQVNTTLLNYLKVDAIAVGNNESELGKECLSKMGKELPLICCNLRTLDDKILKYLRASKIIIKDGVRILMIGTSPFYSADLTCGPYNCFLELDGLKVIEPINEIKHEIEQNKGLFDLCILVSHSGIETDEFIAKNINEIDIIIGGHSHTLLNQPLVINNTIIVQAKAYAEFVGCLDLKIENNRIKGYKYTLNSLSNEKYDSQFGEVLNKCNEYATEQLNETIATIEELEFNLLDECRLINFICDALYLKSACDLAMMYNGIVNCTLKGKISKMDLIKCSPSKLNPTLISVTGQQLQEAFKFSLDEAYCEQSGKAPGFRGDKLGTLSFSHNVSVVNSTLYINNELLDNSKMYKVMVDDYLQRGSRYPSLKTDEKDAIIFKGFIRDVIEENLNNQTCFELSKIRRK